MLAIVMETTMAMVECVAWHVDPKFEVSNHVMCGDNTKEVIFALTVEFLIISQNINL
jgi:hypothetical protein